MFNNHISTSYLVNVLNIYDLLDYCMFNIVGLSMANI